MNLLKQPKGQRGKDEGGKRMVKEILPLQKITHNYDRIARQKSTLVVYSLTQRSEVLLDHFVPEDNLGAGQVVHGAAAQLRVVGVEVLQPVGVLQVVPLHDLPLFGHLHAHALLRRLQHHNHYKQEHAMI